MTQSDNLLRQAQKMREQADRMEERAARIASYREQIDPTEDQVIFFRKRFIPGGQLYTYAAICFKGAVTGQLLWSTTGPQSPKNYTTDQFVEWLFGNEGVEELWVAAEWEAIR